MEKPGTVSMEEMYGLRPKAEKPPVSHQMYLKPIYHKTETLSILCVIITLEKIKTEVAGQAEPFNKTTPKPYPVSEMSIPDIVSKIKPQKE